MTITLSFEFFPPKTPASEEKLLLSAERLAMLRPEFFSVTYGAGGSTREGTFNTVKTLIQNTGIATAPHLSCIGSSRDELISIIKNYQREGIKRMVVLRGDLPSGMGGCNQFNHAMDLVKLIREISGDFFKIDVAAYPECHPQSRDFETELSYFKEKINAGANRAITQYFFNADAYFYFRDSCIQRGINIPIIPGIMPILNFSKLQQFSFNCGAEIPRWLQKTIQSFGEDYQAVHELGLEFITRLCGRLLKGGAPGLHFYTLNHWELSYSICQALNLQRPTKLHKISTVT